jgi:hypothetical protein
MNTWVDKARASDKLAHEDRVKAKSVNSCHIKNPLHYQAEAYCQCGIRYEPRKLTQEMPMNKGSAMKYIIRSGKKNDEIEDLEKAKQFIEFEIDRIKEKRSIANKPAVPGYREG